MCPLCTYAFIYQQFTLNRQLLNEPALATAVVGGQGESLNAAASTDTAGKNVVGVQVITTLMTKGWLLIEVETTTEGHHQIRIPHLQVFIVQVSLVLVSWLVSTMTVRDDGVKQGLEDLIRLLITSDATNSHDEGVT